jgi:hypothetical protein
MLHERRAQRLIDQGCLVSRKHLGREFVPHGLAKNVLAPGPRNGRERYQVLQQAEIEKRMAPFRPAGHLADAKGIEQGGPDGIAEGPNGAWFPMRCRTTSTEVGKALR